MTPFSKFYSALNDGHLPLAIAISDDSGATGISASGADLLPGTVAHKMAFSEDPLDRAALAVWGCHQALINTQRKYRGVKATS